jgi:methylated-DNA-[protein]-cysteine S-methyltransferase
MISYSQIKSPVGDLLLVANSSHLLRLSFVGGKDCPTIQSDWINDPNHPVLAEVEGQLNGFFNRKLTRFSLALGARGTPFQAQVWNEMAQIPYGKTMSYSELADRIGSPKACRAVGMASGQNPIAIIVPCHRVVGKNGALTGFAGGLDRKKRLLELEQVT